MPGTGTGVGGVLVPSAVPGGLSITAVGARVRVRRSTLELLLKVLDVEGAAVKEGGYWRRTSSPWQYDSARCGGG